MYIPAVDSRRCFTTAAGLAALWLACGNEELPEPPWPADVGDTDPAIVELFEAKASEVRRSPRDPGSWRRLGMVYHAHGRLELALECYRQSLELAPNDAKSRYLLALTEERLGRIDDAVAGLRRVIELDAVYAPAHWRLGLWLLDTGDTGGARRSVERALALAPADRAATLALARVELQASRPGAAAELVERHLAGQPGDGYAHFLLGRAYRQLGRGDDAKRELARGRGSEPEWRDPWSDEVDAARTGFRAELDAAIASLGPDPARAVAALERLRSREPDNVGLLINLGIGYRRVERLEDSAEALREAVRLQPARPLAHLHLAVTYGAMSRGNTESIDGGQVTSPRRGASETFARALSHAERTIELRPDSAKGHAVRADLLTRTGRVGEAVESFLQAAELEPDDPQWLYHAASLLTRQGRWRQAVLLLERCLERAPENVDAPIPARRQPGQLGAVGGGGGDARACPEPGAGGSESGAGVGAAAASAGEEVKEPLPSEEPGCRRGSRGS